MKKKRILIIVLIAVLIAILAAATVFLVKPALEIRSLSKLQAEGSPTAQYSDAMPETEEIYSWAETLTDMGERVPGTEAWAKAQDFVVQSFTDLGLENIRTVPSKTTNWHCDAWSLSVAGDEISSYYMPHSFNNGSFGVNSTPEDGLNAELIYVGEGTEADFKKADVEGKIVVCEVKMSSIPIGLAKFASYLYYDPEHTLSLFDSKMNPYGTETYPDNYFLAMNNGAVGFVGVLSNYIDSNTYNNEDLSYIGGADMAIPGLWLSKSDGGALIEMLKTEEDPLMANIRMTVTRSQVGAGAVVGFLPGRSDETIMVQSHYDSVTEGGTEDASGMSVMLALADFYSQIPQDQREKTLMFVAMDTHFTAYDSHDSIIAEYLGEDSDVVANVCVEHISEETEETNGELVLTGLPEPRLVLVSSEGPTLDIVKEEIVRHGYGRTLVVPSDMFGDEVPTDAGMFYDEGVPIVNLISGPIYLYDEADTLDKVAKEELRPTAETFADILWRMMQLSAEELAQ